MNTEPQADAEFTSSFTHDKPGVTSGVFADSHSFTVAGGTFTNVTNNYINALAVPSDVRMVPLGDIDLQHEIHLDNDTGVIARQRQRPRVRRVYSAKMDGRNSATTVAVYQGDNAKESWRQDVAKYMSVRHPNIIQIYGVARSGNINATLFHDELIPFQEFLDSHRHSHFSIVYICAYSEMEFKETKRYFSSTFQRYLSQTACTFAIRRSTGRTCADLVPSGILTYWYSDMEELSRQPGLQPLTAPIDEDMVIKSVPLGHYHKICYWNLSQVRYFPLDISSPVTVNLNAVFAIPPGTGFEDGLVEIALLPDAKIHLIPWTTDREATGVLMENGWTRFNCGDTQDTIIRHKRWYWHSISWLSQANRFFKRLRIMSKFEDYVVMEGIEFSVLISGSASPPLEGFLFLCPAESFETEESTFRWPDCPVYWSLDPTGAERLSKEDALKLRFPSIKRSMAIFGRSWDASVYAGLRKFHWAKGFNPNSLDLALHFGYPLYQLSSDLPLRMGSFMRKDKILAHVYDAFGWSWVIYQLSNEALVWIGSLVHWEKTLAYIRYYAFDWSWMKTVQTLTGVMDNEFAEYPLARLVMDPQAGSYFAQSPTIRENVLWLFMGPSGSVVKLQLVLISLLAFILYVRLFPVVKRTPLM